MIRNTSNKKIISQKELMGKCFLSRASGLMFRKRQNLVMIFSEERKIHLHNFFVFYSIDVILLDTQKKVVEIKENFLPFTFWRSREKAKYVLEIGVKTGEVPVVGDLLEIII